MPPGTWWEYTCMCVSEVTPRSQPPSRRTFSKYLAISKSFSRSSPLSYGVPVSAETTISVAGCELPKASGTVAVSMTSTPASIALR